MMINPTWSKTITQDHSKRTASTK